MNKSFEDLMVIADRLAAGQNRLRDTILKEVLHADILMALHKSDLGKNLVFQGGTALRMCYGNERYSEDLDFVRNAPLNSAHFENFKESLKVSMAERYQLNVCVTDPKRPLSERTTANAVVVHRWTAIIEIEKPSTKNQKIRIEVADIPAYDARPRMIKSPYAQYGASSVLLNVSSEKEILADKVIAVVGRKYIKARDIWDIKWLRDKGIELNLDWVRRKASDYHLIDDMDMRQFIDRLKARIHELALPETHRAFVDEMSRFLAKDQADQWLSDETTSIGLLMDVSDFLEDQIPKLELPLSLSQIKEATAREEKIRAWRERMGVKPEDPKGS